MKYKITYQNGDVTYMGDGRTIVEALAACCSDMREARRMTGGSSPDGTRPGGWQLYREVTTPHWEEIAFNG